LRETASPNTSSNSGPLDLFQGSNPNIFSDGSEMPRYFHARTSRKSYPAIRINFSGILHFGVLAKLGGPRIGVTVWLRFQNVQTSTFVLVMQPEPSGAVESFFTSRKVFLHLGINWPRAKLDFVGENEGAEFWHKLCGYAR